MYKVIAIGLLLCSIQLSAQKDTTQFVTTWRTYNPGISGDSSINLRTNPNYTYNYDVDWNNDGVFDSLGVTGDITHRYNDTGTYTIRIKGTYPAIRFGASFMNLDNEKLLSVDQWGTTAWQDLSFAFKACNNLTFPATDLPNLGNGPSLRNMFIGALMFNEQISNWDVSQVTNMSGMFSTTNSFNQDLSSWNVSSVIDMGGMFTAAFAFNQDLSTWNVSAITNMQDMFRDAIAFNQDISAWNVDNAYNLKGMFERATSFNQDISGLDVSKISIMTSMFEGATSFNQDISAWDVDSVFAMDEMFKDATAFNQDLRAWDVKEATNMSRMFQNATNFNQNLGDWDIAEVDHMFNMLDNTALSISNYDSTLIGWAANAKQGSVNFGAAGLEYCLGDTARMQLIQTSWLITGDSKNCTTVGIKEGSRIAESFKVYPNPSTGVFQIELANQESTSPIFIYNQTGQLVQEIQDPKKQQSIKLSHLKEGLYVLRWGTETRKILMIKD